MCRNIMKLNTSNRCCRGSWLSSFQVKAQTCNQRGHQDIHCDKKVVIINMILIILKQTKVTAMMSSTGF